jgi:hypothetical protein
MQRTRSFGFSPVHQIWVFVQQQGDYLFVACGTRPVQGSHAAKTIREPAALLVVIQLRALQPLRNLVQLIALDPIQQFHMRI